MALTSRLFTVELSQDSHVKEVRSLNPEFMLCGHQSLQRERVEEFIRDKFHHDYRAVITNFMPTLLAVACAPDKISAALGCRSTSVEPLFLEKYLNTSIETRLTEVFGCVIVRDQIVEVGNLAADKRTGSWLLFVALCLYLRRTGAEWVVCTVTPTVANIFRRMGIPFREIAVADGNRLGRERVDWGSYYDKRITVQAISVSDGYASFLQNPCIAAMLPALENDITSAMMAAADAATCL